MNLSRLATRKALQYRCITPSVHRPLKRYSSTVHENDPEVLQVEKDRNLKNTQHETSTPHEHAPGWNEYLASSSEAHVKADRSTGSVEEMQKSTVEHVRKRHKSDETATPAQSESSGEAKYERDEILGPLLKAQKPAAKDAVEGPLSRSTGKEESINHGNTGSEDAVKADRGEH